MFASEAAAGHRSNIYTISLQTGIHVELYNIIREADQIDQFFCDNIRDMTIRVMTLTECFSIINIEMVFDLNFYDNKRVILLSGTSGIKWDLL